MGTDNRNEQEIVFLAYNGMFCFRIKVWFIWGQLIISDDLFCPPQLQYSILPLSLILTLPGACVKYKISIVPVVRSVKVVT